MSMLIKNGNVYRNYRFSVEDVFIDDKGYISNDIKIDDNTTVIDATGLLVTAGLIDPHVHLREPGFEYKETIHSGTLSAAAGGFTTVMAMPNLNPVPDCLENLNKQLDIIKTDALINVLPYSSITKGQKGVGQLVDFEEMAPYVIGFSDDGKGVQEQYNMLEAMKQAKKTDRFIVAHCEDESLLVKGGCVHEGIVSEKFGYQGISSASEYKQIQRDLQLCKETGAKYHVCHISTIEAVESIKKAKQEGVNVSAEVTVHHLLLNEEDITSDDGKFKMNPPLRSVKDQKALIQGLKEGTIDMIATDHAPHSKQEKSKGLQGSSMGIIGSELAFGMIYTKLVKTGVITLEKALEAMSDNVAKRFGLKAGRIEDGYCGDLAVFDLNSHKIISEENIKSAGKSTPFIGEDMYGLCKYTIVAGKIVYSEVE